MPGRQLKLVDLAAVSVGGKSRRRNNFGSYTWYKRSGKRIDFMPAFHHFGTRNRNAATAKAPCVII